MCVCVCVCVCVSSKRSLEQISWAQEVKVSYSAVTYFATNLPAFKDNDVYTHIQRNTVWNYVSDCVESPLLHRIRARLLARRRTIYSETASSRVPGVDLFLSSSRSQNLPIFSCVVMHIYSLIMEMEMLKET